MQILTDLADILGFETGNNANILAPSIVPVVVTQSLQGASVNMQNYQLATAAIIDVGVEAAGLTNLAFQVEEWNGTTANGSTWAAIVGEWYGTAVATSGTTVNPVVATSAGSYCFLGLRTQGFARINCITATGTTVSVPVNGRLIGMPKSSGQVTGTTRLPSS